MKVHFDLSPPLEESLEETECGPQRNVVTTGPTTQTTTPQVSSKAKHLAELLKDLSGDNFPELASVLLSKIGSRERVHRRRRKRPTGNTKKRYRDWELVSSGSSSDSSYTGSTGRDWSGTETSTTDTEDDQDQACTSNAIQTRLAPLFKPEDLRPLGPPI